MCGKANQGATLSLQLTARFGTNYVAMIPGGTPHTHSCKADSACVLSVQQDGPNDNVAVNN